MTRMVMIMVMINNDDDDDKGGQQDTYHCTYENQAVLLSNVLFLFKISNP